MQIDGVVLLFPGLIRDVGEVTPCGSEALIAVTWLNTWSLAHRRRGRELRCLLAAKLGAVLRLTCLLQVDRSNGMDRGDHTFLSDAGVQDYSINPSL